VNAPGSRGWLVALVVLAAVFPVGVLIAPALWPSRSHQPAVSGRLNAPVLLITIAGLRADRLHHLGYGPEITPNLDRLAEQGQTFRTCWAQSNQSAASAAALLTGQCPASTGVSRSGERLKPGQETLGSIFAAGGFRAVALVANPELQDSGLAAGFDIWLSRPGASAFDVVHEGMVQIEIAPDSPWLVWLDFADLLPPYGGADLDVAAFAPEAPPGFGASPEDYDLTDADLAARGWGPREIGWLATRYDAALLRLDAALGHLFDALASQNRLETLIVCVAGLRGERLDERPPRRFVHGVDLFESSLRVPLLFRLPAQESRGLVTTRLAQLIDVGPTLADLALRRDWQTAQGRSLKPVIQSQVMVDKAVFADGFVEPEGGGAPQRAAAVRAAIGKVNVKGILDADGRLLDAFRFPDDPQELKSFPVAAQQAELLGKQWAAALGDQAGCVPLPK